MEITEEQYRRIEPVLPRQRGNVSMSNLKVLNAISLAEGAEEVFPDAMAREMAQNLAADSKAVEKSVAAMVGV